MCGSEKNCMRARKARSLRTNSCVEAPFPRECMWTESTYEPLVSYDDVIRNARKNSCVNCAIWTSSHAGLSVVVVVFT